jgi:hypothetical protein
MHGSINLKKSVSIFAKGISKACNFLFVLQQHQKAVDLYATFTLEIFYIHLKRYRREYFTSNVNIQEGKVDFRTA